MIDDIERCPICDTVVRIGQMVFIVHTPEFCQLATRERIALLEHGCRRSELERHYSEAGRNEVLAMLKWLDNPENLENVRTRILNEGESLFQAVHFFRAPEIEEARGRRAIALEYALKEGILRVPNGSGIG